MATPVWVPTQANLKASTPWTAGDASGFGTPPTDSQLNASSDLNQMIGDVNRLSSQLSLGSAFSYVSSGTTLDGTTMGNIQTRINSARTTVGLSSYSFTNTLASGKAFKKLDFFELRDALDLTITLNATFSAWYWAETFFNVATMLQDYTSGTGDFTVGEGSTNSPRYRGGVTFALPTIHGSGVTASFLFPLTSQNISGQDYTAKLYSSNSDDSGGGLPTSWSSGWQAHLDNLCGTCSSGTGTRSIAVPNSVLAGRSGNNCSFVLGTSNELAGSGVGTLSLFSVTHGSGGAIQLVISY